MATTFLSIGIVLGVLAAQEYEPTTSYEVQAIEGWTCYVNKRLLADHAALADRTLAVLRVKLFDITRTVPAAALTELQKIPIWVEADDDRHNPCCCYHVSADWLRENGFNPEKARSVEICNATRFLQWTHEQPSMLLHELAHGYHHRVLGYDEPRLVGAFERAKQDGKYEKVLRFNGHSEKHYALNNPQEYFAEGTEAFFGANDFYPFVRAELEQHDPALAKLLRDIWGDPDSPRRSETTLPPSTRPRPRPRRRPRKKSTTRTTSRTRTSV